MFLSAQVPLPKTSSLSVNTMFLRTMSLFSRDSSDRRKTLAAGAEDRSQRLVGVNSRHFLLWKESMTLQKGNDRSSPRVNSTDPRRLERRVSSKPARVDFEMRPATPPRRRSPENGRQEGSERVTIIIGPGSENRVRFEKTNLGQSAWK